MNKNSRLLTIAYLGLFTALVIIMTMIPKIPVPQTKGYINLGDSMILLGVFFFGGWFGAFIGAFGSALADILGGYAHFAPYTFVIKGIEPLILAFFLTLFKRKSHYASLIVSSVMATSWMVLGYYIVEVILYGHAAAVIELPGNIFQAIGSVVIATALFKALTPKIPSRFLSDY